LYGEELLEPLTTTKLEDHLLSAVHDCLFNIFAVTLHIWTPFLHPQPEDAPCSGEDPFITDTEFILKKNFLHKRKCSNNSICVIALCNYNLCFLDSIFTVTEAQPREMELAFISELDSYAGSSLVAGGVTVPGRF
jgi:hypothetical protein